MISSYLVMCSPRRPRTNKGLAHSCLLEGVENALTEEKSCSAIANAFNKLELMDFSLEVYKFMVNCYRFFSVVCVT